MLNKYAAYKELYKTLFKEASMDKRAFTMVEALLMGPALGGLSAMGTGKLKASVDGRDYDNKLRDYMIGSSLATTGTAGGVILENMLPRSSMGKTKLSKALSL